MGKYQILTTDTSLGNWAMKCTGACRLLKESVFLGSHWQLNKTKNDLLNNS